MFLRNEPELIYSKTIRIYQIWSGLCKKLRKLQSGSFFGKLRIPRTLTLSVVRPMGWCRCRLLEWVLVSWEMVAANNSGVSSDSARQAQHDKSKRVRGCSQMYDVQVGREAEEGKVWSLGVAEETGGVIACGA